MLIVIIDGYEYLEEEGEEPVLVVDEDGLPLKEDKTVKRWIKNSEKEYTLVHGVKEGVVQ